MDSKSKEAITLHAPDLIVEARNSPQIHLIDDRFKWPIVIILVLREHDEKNPVTAPDIVREGVRRYRLQKVSPNYIREIVSALRAGEVRIGSARSAGYWWGWIDA